VLIDGAHNPAGARALRAYLGETYGRPVPLVLGVMKDKKIERIVEALAPAASCVVCTAAASPRAEAAADLAAIVTRVTAGAIDVLAIDRPIDALAEAARRGTPAVVAGSLYLAGEIRAEIS
jgi:dihydrofolate synthase/folylpolyglutamate synthase